MNKKIIDNIKYISMLFLLDFISFKNKEKRLHMLWTYKNL